MPFGNTNAVDHFTLEQPQPTTNTLIDIIADGNTFQRCLQTLSNNKCPGPDGIVNGIIKALHTDGKAALHLMMQLMWMTGITPATWKHSITVLIYKHKGTSSKGALALKTQCTSSGPAWSKWQWLTTESAMQSIATAKQASGANAQLQSKWRTW
jgi:hypothetical protein